ncbi:spermatogenesis-associated protein 20-like [Pyrus x bretschneideri]|uniref:spermatogenesis-associated protein 20-like n=1 Tax=Pyrus x bretschneideri TaxID=225117 RepID=UPI00202FA5B7|nr:spermatogenesis-associated protein 20-like [Pyrus x bretschneideri]
MAPTSALFFSLSACSLIQPNSSPVLHHHRPNLPPLSSLILRRPISASKPLAMAEHTSSNPAAPSHKHSNRLAAEHSPYLLQHAHNPVDWYPWGEEAFAEARKRDVPVFLSIGYSGVIGEISCSIFGKFDFNILVNED